MGAVLLLGYFVRAHAAPPAPAPVRSGCFAFTVLLHRQAVPRGAPFAFSVVARNVTRYACAGPDCPGITPSYDIRGLFGRLVYREYAAGVSCRSDVPPPRQIAPGAVTTWIVESWDGLRSWQGVCKPGNCHLTRPAAVPGPYRVVWHLVPEMSVDSAWFHITA